MQNKYLISLTYGIKNQLSEKGQLIGRIFVYWMVVVLFLQIFKAVHAPSSQFCYFRMTEAIVLSTFLVAFEIAFDMQKGQMVYFLLSPVNYIGYRLCYSLGISIVRYTLLMLCYVAFNLISGDNFYPSFFLGFVSGMIGIFLYTQISFLLGIISFWVRDIRSLVYLNLTATFCFGGLIVPIEDYSHIMRLFSFITPYPWILWWPAQQMVGHSQPFYYFAVCLFWGIILGTLNFLFYRKYIRCIAKEEG